MQFRTEEIEMARQLRRLGLPWEPKTGHYVYDETGLCRKTSPFQDGVNFVLIMNTSCVKRAVLNGLR